MMSGSTLLLSGTLSVCLLASLPAAEPVLEPTNERQRVAQAKPLQVEQVLDSVRKQYPPLLAIWLQQDIATGRVRKAEGSFDTTLTASLQLRPVHFYDATNAEVLFDRPFRNSGGSIYGGYRITGGFLPEYERKIRNADGGEAVLGFRLPLLQDREFDTRRATLKKAELDKELARPIILRQQLDFLRAARVAYYTWVGAGKRLAVAEQVLQVAKERDSSIREKVREGALAPILQVDNYRLVISREIAVLKAKREFEGSAIALSLFYRNLTTGQPLLPTRANLPLAFPPIPELAEFDLISDRARALFRRPEVRQIDFLLSKGLIDRRLAENNLKPKLDLLIEINQAIGSNRPDDIDQFEIEALFNYSIPIGRNEAKGRIQVVDANIAKLKTERKFAHQQIIADTNDSYTAFEIAGEALKRTLLNVQLSEELERAESEMFAQGASDLLALQIREQATFDARQLEIDARFHAFRALANYYAAVALDAPSHLGALSK